MELSRLMLLPVLAALVPGCVASHETDYGNPAERAVILGVLETYYDDFSARDWEGYAGHFWPGADITTVWQPPGETRDRVVPTTIEEFVKQAPVGPGSKPIFEERLLDAEIRVFHNLAQAWVRYAAQFGTPDSTENWEGIDAFTLLQHGGTWKITSLAFTNENDE
jgi:hypothetical protein